MRIYMAGLYSTSFSLNSANTERLDDSAKYERKRLKHHLESFHYIKKGNAVRLIREDGHQIFLDSGAFSDFTKGVNTSLEDYSKFLHDNSDIIEVASVLDSIGDSEKTLHNQAQLEKMGHAVLPCFHYGEDLGLLQYYLKNYEHITLGGMVPISTPDLKIWLDELWGSYLVDGSGNIRARVHGFGMTSTYLIERYPWYSVDSSTWVQAARVGELCFPDMPRIQVSNKSDSRKDAGKHINSMNEVERNIVLDAIHKRGYSELTLAEDYRHRWAFNCGTFQIMEDKMTETPPIFKKEQELLF